ESGAFGKKPAMTPPPPPASPFKTCNPRNPADRLSGASPSLVETGSLKTLFTSPDYLKKPATLTGALKSFDSWRRTTKYFM
ncbi:hypothetical protein, partial [Pseudomonas syringae]|uniref:hypothetical protein n=1 Tax=Pseudomonas syringae TaxID=317 RepID=UPI001E586432